MWNGFNCDNCNSTSAIIFLLSNLSSWQCIDCENPLSYTLSRNSLTSCNCFPNLIWNLLGYCDCGPNSAMIISGSFYTCVVCNSSIYSTGQYDSYSCACPIPLIWNYTANTCDCGPSAVVANTSTGYQCVVCTGAIWASAKYNTTSCYCLSSVLYWSYVTFQCVCIQVNSVVILISGGVHTCVACNSSIFAVSLIDFITCSCQSSFVWLNNSGCICSDPQAAAVSNGTGSICVNCNSIVYSTGKKSTTTCACINNLSWLNGTCTCNSTYALLPNISCIKCGSLVGASGLLNATTCTCISGYLAWLPSQGICGCTNSNAVFIGASTYKTCLNCSNSIYAVSPNTSTTCNCMSSNLTWDNTNKICNCGTNMAFYMSGSNFICVDCTNSSYFTLSQKNSTFCSCLSSALVWSVITGTCQCSNSQAIILISGNSYLCMICNSAIFASNLSTPLTCNCLSTTLTWNSTSGSCGCNSTSVVYAKGNYLCVSCINSIYAMTKFNATTCNCIDPSFIWMGNFCNCLAGSIIRFNFTCFACSTKVTISNFTCNCSTASSPNSIWNDITQTCVTCGSTVVLNSVIGSYGVACKCVSGYFWDAMTNTCIVNCISAGCTMNCGSIPNVLTGSVAVAVSSISVRNIPGGLTISAFYTTVGSNYASISSMACQCSLGYSWDSLRLRCYSNSINLQ